jgi:RNA polymerase primary sigma factor
VPRSPRPKDGVDDGGELAFYMAEAKRHKVMTREEEQTLARKVRAGGAEGAWARNEFVRRNMRLVVTLARRYTTEDLTIADVVQEGCIGLMRAVEKFDPDKGFKFSTYASWWVRQAIVRAIHNAGAIRLPPYIVTAKYQIARLERSLDAPLTDEALSERTGFSPAMLNRLRVLPVALAVLDAPVGEDDDGDLFVDLVSDPAWDRGTEAERGMEQAQIKVVVEKVLEGVSPRDRGLFLSWVSEEGVSLAELGSRAGLTRERARQILFAIIKTLKKELALGGEGRGEPSDG